MSSSITFSGIAGRIIWVYETRGCGIVTPEEFRKLWQLREEQLGRTLEYYEVPWDLEISGEFALEVGSDTVDDYPYGLGDPNGWGYCDHCGDRGGNAEYNAEGELGFVCQRCDEVFADPSDDPLRYS